MSQATFKLNLLQNYQLVTKPGTYYVSVAYTVTESNLYMDEHPRYIVPLRAITSASLVELLKILEHLPEIPFSDIKHLFLSGALWYGDGMTIDEGDLPIKGEKVLATFDYVERDTGKQLLCTHIELLPREELDYVDIYSLDNFLCTLNTLLTKA